MNGIGEFVDAVEKGARNGTKAHIPAEVLRAVIADPAWMGYVASRRLELMSQWEEQQPPPVPNSETTGSGIAPSATSGTSAGTIPPELAAEVGLAAARQASEAVDQVRRRGKQSAP